MRKLLLTLVATLCLCCSMQGEQRFRYYDHITFYDVYAGTVSEDVAPVPEGIFRLNNSRLTTLLPASDLDQMGDSLTLEVTIHALCDNYDRIGSVDLVLMSKDSLIYNDCWREKPGGGHYSGRLGNTDPTIKRIEVARYITPFMNKNNQPDAVPYHWDISFLAPMLHDHALRDSMNLWLEFHLEGVPYAANTQVAGCAGRNDVFAGTLEIVSNTAHSTSPFHTSAYYAEAKDGEGGASTTSYDGKAVVEPLVYERYINNYNNTDEAGTTVAHYQVHVDEPLTDAMFLMINSNHGANSGGEEYNRRLHYVWVNEWMAEVYRPGRQSCEPFRQYNTQGNGIYGGSPQSDESWQSFSNWCPGDVIDNHIIHLGAIPAGDYDFRLLVPDAIFNGGEGYFPFSLTLLGLREGELKLDKVEADSERFVSIGWEGDELVVKANAGHSIESWTLLNTAGQRLMVQPGGATRLSMSHYPTGTYILLFLMEDGAIESHKFFRP